MNNEVLFSSKSDLWSTRQSDFEKLNNEFNFTLDACATWYNAKCPKWCGYQFDENEFDDDFVSGLIVNWQGEIVFCNPPYSQVSDWVEKCSVEGKKQNTTVVLLIPSRTDTKYFHRYIWDKSKNKPRKGVEVRFLEGRLKFGDSKNAAPFPSVVVIFKKKKRRKKNAKRV